MSSIELERRYSKELISSGILPHLRGYKYLIAAFLYVSERKYRDYGVLNIYKAVASDYKVTPVSVERCIRHAISKTDIAMRNGEYIASVAEKVRLAG